MPARKSLKGAYSSAEGQKCMMAESVGMTYAPPRRVDLTAPGDYGADPIGDGRFRMVPSGDVVDYAERMRRLAKADCRKAE